jgi:D-aspartate ligase
MRQSPPAVIVGGGENALSVARSLSKAGVEVCALNEPQALIRYSRFARWVPTPAGASGWAEHLLGPAESELAGAVLLPCSDDAIEMICENHAALSRRYLLEEGQPAVRTRLLSKLDSYVDGAAAGVPTARFWHVGSLADVRAVRRELVFPVLIKPIFSHAFQKVGRGKFVQVEDYDELLREFEGLEAQDVRFILMEFIPGPDDRLCSYYTYLDEAGEPLLDFTKRIIRRYPTNMGRGSYHITDWIPEVRELGLQFLRYTGYRGLANVEFKWDARDRKLKLIECNARFTAADNLIRASGIDLPLFVYRRLTGQPLPAVNDYKRGLRMWYPRADLLAFLELRRRGDLALSQWLRGLAHPQVLPAFAWSDPVPAVVDETRFWAGALERMIRRRLGGVGLRVGRLWRQWSGRFNGHGARSSERTAAVAPATREGAAPAPARVPPVFSETPRPSEHPAGR